MFTIEVEKKEQDEKFSLENLKMFHQECLGGQILYSPSRMHWEYEGFSCERCGVKKSINPSFSDEERIGIIRIVIEGGELKLRQDIVVVQKS